MALRIVGGRLGGRRIEAPAGRGVRPTSERVREAWFSALGARLAGGRVLDLFAGSGALGIEALSRGAAFVQFVEADRRTCALLARNLAAVEVGAGARIARADVFAWLDRHAGEDPFRIALADPPYRSGAAARLVARFEAAPFAGLLCLEHAVSDPPGGHPVWQRRYGDTALSFYEPDTEGDGGGGTA
ncbi:MAG: 16S rRNA (guanine(966)-N(2))-methyltransferase RsmD [Gemmatimonadota bacterium]|nr:16S rRNA (guanine(966)-N(2))-methyltransferase RsmD [Gemmatimonadota bacterium]